MSDVELRAGINAADVETALRHGDVQRIRISPSLSPVKLAEFIAKLRRSAYSEVFLELLASESISSDTVWRAVLEDPVDASVAMTALSNGSIPQAEVVRLLNHSSTQVQGHALLARLQHQVPLLGESELSELLDAHAGDHGVSLGVRHLVARSPGTPRRILQRLADDEVDFIAESARGQLEA